MVQFVGKAWVTFFFALQYGSYNTISGQICIPIQYHANLSCLTLLIDENRHSLKITNWNVLTCGPFQPVCVEIIKPFFNMTKNIILSSSKHHFIFLPLIKSEILVVMHAARYMKCGNSSQAYFANCKFRDSVKQKTSKLMCG
jgi:hypothetical protein